MRNARKIRPKQNAERRRPRGTGSALFEERHASHVLKHAGGKILECVSYCSLAAAPRSFSQAGRRLRFICVWNAPVYKTIPYVPLPLYCPAVDH